MKIAFKDICKTGNRYDITDDSWFPADKVERSKDVHAEVSLKRKGEERVDASGYLHTGVILTCDRCLASYDYEIKSRFHLILEVPTDDSWHVRELELTDNEGLDSVQLEAPLVDLDDILRQQLFLSLPEKALCSVGCKGLCVTCGIDLNTAGCSCEQDKGISPFAVLAGLKKQ